MRMKNINMRRLIVAMMVFAFMLAGCGNNPPVTPFPTSIPQYARVIIEKPAAGETIFIGKEVGISGVIDPLPSNGDGKISVVLVAENSDPLLSGSADYDISTGKWSLTSTVAITFTGPAYIQANSLAVLPGQSAVNLSYAPNDNGVYVNLNHPKSADAVVYAGTTLSIAGTSHNAINGEVQLKIRDAVNNITLDENVPAEQVDWGYELPVGNDWKDSLIEIEVCSGDSADAAWCGTVKVPVVSMESAQKRQLTVDTPEQLKFQPGKPVTLTGLNLYAPDDNIEILLEQLNPDGSTTPLVNTIATSDAQGKWKVDLELPTAAPIGPATLTVVNGKLGLKRQLLITVQIQE